MSQFPASVGGRPLHARLRYRAVIFDLDDTLFPVSSLAPELLEPARAAARRANAGPGSVAAEHLERALAAAGRQPFLRVAREHGLPVSVVQAWSGVHASTRVSGTLAPFDDVVPVLSHMAQRRFLVTTGFRVFQESKVAALGVASLFDRIYIDAVDDPAGHVGKVGTFRRLLEECDLEAAHVLVVGDDDKSEIDAGRALGMTTVQILRPGIVPATGADYRINSLYELLAMCG